MIQHLEVIGQPVVVDLLQHICSLREQAGNGPYKGQLGAALAQQHLVAQLLRNINIALNVGQGRIAV
ncbi:hypothetical protein K7A41_02790 [Sphingobacterium sp. InxBP1]|uniref:hypothetical protein n=1 Tax=Sphingobacterium sp. InxBP1 TaxID=2870328 RepID=UPI00224310F1|nr:hypothetical protein [Sphingobacterium sp. InxBP1]MCW8310145.1 hypothetical protein [Sphingobacterium sp. InxBP1]